MGRELGFGEPRRQGDRPRPDRARPTVRPPRRRAGLDQAELRLAAADQLEIDLGQNLGVEQRAVLGAARIVDAEAGAQIVEPVGSARIFAAGQQQGIDHAVARDRGLPARSSSALRKPRSNVALWATSGASPMNAIKLLGHLGKQRLVLEEVERQAMDREGLGRHVAFAD